MKIKAKTHGMVSIDTILKSSFERLGLKTRIREFTILNVWGKVVGNSISKSTLPIKMTGKTLYVTVSNSAWMEELKYHKADIVSRINEKLGEDCISDIIFKMGKIDSIHFHKKQDVPVNHCSLTPEGKKAIDELTLPLKDEELKKAIANAAARQKMILNSSDGF